MRLALVLLVACRPPATQTGIDPAAVPLLDAWAAAVGGRARLADVHVVHVTGTCSGNGFARAFERWETDRGELRSADTVAGLHELDVYDGRRGWDQDASGLVVELGGAELDEQRTRAYLASASPLVAGRLSGTVTKVDERTLRIVADGSEIPAVLTFDPVTHLPARQVMVEGGSTTTTELGDWREVDGVRYAFTSRATSDDVRTCTTTSIDHQPATFEPPADRRGDIRFTQPAPVAVPLEIGSAAELRARISIDGSAPHSFIVDTGAPTMLDPSRLADVALHPVSAGTYVGQNVVDTFGFAPGVTISVPGLALGPYTPRTLAFGKAYPNLDASIAGLLGGDLFVHLVVEIDYPGHVLRFHDPATYHHSGTGVPFVYAERAPVIRGTLEVPNGPPIEGGFMIDTGCECELVAMRTAAEAHHLRDLPAIASNASMTAHRATALTIGTTRIAAPTVVISRAATDGILDMKPLVALIGGRLLRQYRVTLDYPHRTMWLDP